MNKRKGMRLRTKRWLISIGTAIPVVATSVVVPLILLNKKANSGSEGLPNNNGNPLSTPGGHGGSTGRLHHPGFELKADDGNRTLGRETYRFTRNENDENDITLDLGAGYGDVNQADWEELFWKNPLRRIKAIFAKDDISGSWRATEYDIEYSPHLPASFDTNHNNSYHYEMIAKDKSTHEEKFRGKLTIRTHEVHYGPVLRGRPYILKHKPDGTYEIHVRSGDYNNINDLKRSLDSGIQFCSDIIHPEFATEIPYPRGWFPNNLPFSFGPGEMQKVINYSAEFGMGPSSKDAIIKVIIDAPSSTKVPTTFSGFRFTDNTYWHNGGAGGMGNQYGANVHLFSDGKIVSTGTRPSYEWRGAPEGTQAFGIIVTDETKADHPVHSLILGIDPSAQTYLGSYPIHGLSIKANYFQGIKDNFANIGNQEWFGPCPPKGETHNYKFELLAFKSNDFRWVGDELKTVTSNAEMYRIIKKIEAQAIPGTAQAFMKQYVGYLIY